MDTALVELIGAAGITSVIVAGILWFVLQRSVDGARDALLSQLDHRLELQRMEWNSNLERQIVVDVDLRTRRAEVYEELWRFTGELPLWPINSSLTKGDLFRLSTSLKEWYFERGGMYLSSEARKRYTPVQEAITSNAADSSAEPVTATVYDDIRSKCSQLRTELTRDLESRARYEGTDPSVARRA